MTLRSAGARLFALGLFTLPLSGCLLPFDFEEGLNVTQAAPAPAVMTVSYPVARPDEFRERRAVATPVSLGGGSVGMASYYGRELHGRRKANGEIFNMNELTAAHRSLPFGTRVKVTNLANGRSVVVRITDRGPFTRGRIIDLSFAAARQLDFIRRGVAKVRVEKL